jgi:hypothetical protein
MEKTKICDSRNSNFERLNRPALARYKATSEANGGSVFGFLWRWKFNLDCRYQTIPEKQQDYYVRDTLGSSSINGKCAEARSHLFLQMQRITIELQLHKKPRLKPTKCAVHETAS